jgi:hypothetical protein
MANSPADLSDALFVFIERNGLRHRVLRHRIWVDVDVAQKLDAHVAYGLAFAKVPLDRRRFCWDDETGDDVSVALGVFLPQLRNE